MSETPEIRNIKPQKSSRSLTVTLTISFVVLSIATLVFSTASNLFFSFQMQQKIISDQQHMIVQDTATIVADFLKDLFAKIDQAAAINDIIAATPERQTLIMDKLLGRNSEFRQLFVLDLEGRELQRRSSILGTGNPLTPTIKTALLVQIQKGTTYISPVYIDPTTNEPLVLIVTPIRDAFKDPKGAFVGEVNLKFMWNLVGSIRIGDKGVAYIVDKQGNLLAFGDSSRVLARENLATLQEVGQFMSNASHIGMENEISTGIQGTKVVSVFVPLGTPDWAVVVETPILEAYAPILQVALYAFLILVFGVIFAMMIGIYLSIRITKPILQLNDAIKDISMNKSYTKIEIESKNEIGQLADTFNGMSEELSHYTQNLEQEVKKSMSALNEKVSELEKFQKLTLDRELRMIELKKENEELKSRLT